MAHKWTEKEIAEFREAIRAKREEALEDLGFLKKAVIDSIEGSTSGSNSTYSYHMADQSSDAAEREKTLMLAHRENKYLMHLYEAEERLKTGTYGICRSCNKPIPKPRLLAVPNATLCVTCKSQREG